MVMGEILKVLEDFHHWVARKIAAMTTRHTEGREWLYPPVADLMEALGLCLIKEYIKRQKSTIAEQVACRPIYEICTGAERMPGSIQMVRWWGQEVVRK